MTLNLESTPLNERKNVPRQSVSNRMYSKKSSWEVQVEGVNKMNKRRSTSKRKSDSVSINDLYKLNIGVGSSWDKQKENLIPLNPTPGSKWTASRREDEAEFVRILESYGVPVTVRDTRGREIDGACGQLAAAEKGKPVA